MASSRSSSPSRQQAALSSGVVSSPRPAPSELTALQTPPAAARQVWGEPVAHQPPAAAQHPPPAAAQHQPPLAAPQQAAPPASSWRDYIPNLSSVGKAAGHLADNAAAALAISHAAMTGNGQVGRGRASGGLWAAGAAANAFGTAAGMVEQRNDPPGNPSTARKMADIFATGAGFAADALNSGAGIASAFAAEGDNSAAGRASNGMWAAGGAAGAVSGLTSLATSFNDWRLGKAGANWRMASAGMQTLSGAANFAAGVAGYKAVDHNDSDGSSNNTAAAWLWQAGAVLGTAGTLLAVKGRRAELAQQRPAPHADGDAA